MNDRATQPPADETRPHTATVRITSELELIIAGALLFGLLTVPGRIDAWWATVRPHVAGDLQMAYFLGYYYLMLIAYTLIATFCVHIGARAYWVGLMGLQAVYPEGPDWARLNRGPVGINTLRSRVPTLARASDLADDFCSLIFSFAFLIVLYLIASVFWAALIGGVALLLKIYLFPNADIFFLGFGLFGIIFIPMSIAGIVDSKLKERLDPEAKLGKAVSWLLRANYYASFGPVAFPLFLTFASRFRPKTFYPLMGVVGAAVLGMFLLRTFSESRSGPGLESYRLFPATRTELSLDYRLYGNLRPEGRVYFREPYIQSDVVTDPYVRLFLPYYPLRDNDLLDEICPDAKPLPDEGFMPGADEAAPEDLRVALGCLASMFEISINGAPLADARYHFFEDPASGVHGILTHIATGSLPSGFNELRVVRRSSEADKGRPREKERRLYVIPFWR